MHSGACGVHAMSMIASRNAALSRTAPAAVIHDRCACGERKNGSAPNEVWVSRTSVNHPIQASQNGSS